MFTFILVTALSVKVFTLFPAELAFICLLSACFSQRRIRRLRLTLHAGDNDSKETKTANSVGVSRAISPIENKYLQQSTVGSEKLTRISFLGWQTMCHHANNLLCDSLEFARTLTHTYTHTWVHFYTTWPSGRVISRKNAAIIHHTKQ